MNTSSILRTILCTNWTTLWTLCRTYRGLYCGYRGLNRGYRGQSRHVVENNVDILDYAIIVKDDVKVVQIMMIKVQWFTFY